MLQTVSTTADTSKPKPNQTMDTDTIRGYLKQYNEADANAKAWQKKKNELRDMISEGCFGAQTPDKEGTEKVEIAGCIVKRACKLTRSLTKDEDELRLAMQNLEGSVAKERLIKWSPDMSVAEYRKLSAHDKAVIDSVLTVKLGAPTLTIEGDFSE